MTEQKSWPEIQHALIDELEAEDNDEEKPSRERLYYIYGYLNAYRGSMDYDSNFSGSDYPSKNDANNDVLRTSFFAGMKQSISDGVALGGGLSDGYKFISDEKIKYCHKWNRQAFQTFIDGVADGYNRIFSKDPLTEKDVHAFVLAAGEQARRDASVMPTLPRDMPWLHPSPKCYERIQDAICTIVSEENRYPLLLDLAESIPHYRETSDYQKIFDIGLINFLIRKSESLGALNVIQLRLKNQFTPDRADLTDLLKQRTAQIARHILETGDNLTYSTYAKGDSYRPRGMMEPVLIDLEREFEAAAKEVYIEKAIGRVFVVFNNVTGPCVINRVEEDLKTGFPVAILKSQEQMPDLYLPPAYNSTIRDGATAEQRQKAISLMQEITTRQASSRREMYETLRVSIPQIDAIIAQMSIK